MQEVKPLKVMNTKQRSAIQRQNQLQVNRCHRPTNQTVLHLRTSSNHTIANNSRHKSSYNLEFLISNPIQFSPKFKWTSNLSSPIKRTLHVKHNKQWWNWT